jgi:hypothetical protein
MVEKKLEYSGSPPQSSLLMPKEYLIISIYVSAVQERERGQIPLVTQYNMRNKRSLAYR